MICDQLKEKHVDFCVIGRRGAGGVTRFFMGSNSKYVMEHAEATVIVVKGDWGPAELHDDKQAVLDAEEQERQRRMKHEGGTSGQHDAAARSALVDHVRDAIAKHSISHDDDNDDDAADPEHIAVEKHFGEEK
jgi:Universal stress protein family